MITVWRPEPVEKTGPVWVMFSFKETGQMSLTGVSDDNYMTAKQGAKRRAEGNPFIVIDFMKSFSDVRGRLISFLRWNGVTDDEEIVAYLNNTGYAVAQLFDLPEPMTRRLRNQHAGRLNFNGDAKDRSDDPLVGSSNPEGSRILPHDQDPMAGLESTTQSGLGISELRNIGDRDVAVLDSSSDETPGPD